MDAVERALAHGVKIQRMHGSSRHGRGRRRPDPAPVGGPVLPTNTVETLHARIQVEEHRILPEAIDLIAEKSRFSPSVTRPGCQHSRAP